MIGAHCLGLSHVHVGLCSANLSTFLLNWVHKLLTARQLYSLFVVFHGLSVRVLEEAKLAGQVISLHLDQHGKALVRSVSEHFLVDVL